MPTTITATEILGAISAVDAQNLLSFLKGSAVGSAPAEFRSIVQEYWSAVLAAPPDVERPVFQSTFSQLVAYGVITQASFDAINARIPLSPSSAPAVRKYHIAVNAVQNINEWLAAQGAGEYYVECLAEEFIVKTEAVLQPPAVEVK